MTDIVAFPKEIYLRDTTLYDDLGGLGQRIYTNAGSGYTKQQYIRADVVQSLRQQLAECQAREKVLRDALVDLRSCMEGVIEGDYEPDSFTLQPSNIALAMPSDSTKGK